MKYNLYHLTCLPIAALMLLSACERDDRSDTDRNNGIPQGTFGLSVRAVQSGFMDEEGKTRAATNDTTMQTTFQPGDAIGFYAVKNGVVLNDYKNLKLTMQADSTWTGTKEVYFTEGTTYFAYSPYISNDARFNQVTNTDDIMNLYTSDTYQETEARFRGADWMVTSSCEVNKESKSLTMSFKHKCALIEVQYAYCKNSNTGFLYPLNSVSLNGKQIGVGSTSFTPYSINGKLWLLLKPGTYTLQAPPFKRTDTTSGTVPSFGTTTATLEGGRHYKLKPYKDRDIQVGDYYYVDGTIYPKEWPSPPTIFGPPPPTASAKPLECIGVVFATAYPDANKLNILPVDQNRGWKNAYVVSIGTSWYIHKDEYSEPTFLGDHFDSGPSGNNYGWIYNNTYSGYDYMVSARRDNPYMVITKYGETYKLYKYPMCYFLDYSWSPGSSYIWKLSPAPAGTSGWFPPSARQASMIFRNMCDITGGLYNSPDPRSWSDGTVKDIQKFAKAWRAKTDKINISGEPGEVDVSTLCCTGIEGEKPRFVCMRMCVREYNTLNTYYIFDTTSYAVNTVLAKVAVMPMLAF